MNFYKINKGHTIILFFLALIFLSTKILNLNYEIPFLPIICFFLISTIGITHGALDNSKGNKILKLYKIKQNYFFYLVYIILAILVIFIWSIFSLFTLCIFLIVASYHFGKEDSNFEVAKKSKFMGILYLFKGSAVVWTPLIFHSDETLKIFEILNVSLISIDINFLIFFLFISFISNFFINDDILVSVADWLTILMLNVTFVPLIAFTIYFCFLHSVRHSISLIFEINEKNFNKGLKIFIKKALPLTILTGIFYLIAVFYLMNFYTLDESILKVIFIGLASLTFPHILLEYLIEKNEK